MKTENILRMKMIWSGKYDMPAQFVALSGVDAMGMPVEERIPIINGEMFELDLARFRKNEGADG